MRRAALLLAGALLASGSGSAHPIDVICPGGVSQDTLVFEYPVIRSPALLSLRAPSLLSSETRPSDVDSTVARVVLASVPDSAPPAPAATPSGSQASLPGPVADAWPATWSWRRR